MDEMTKLLYDTKKLMMLRYPRFASEIAAANISYKKDLKYHTAATDGKNIYFDPNFLASISESDRLFLIAHELMHIKFAHAYRLVDKDGKRRDFDVWNIATDAIINANLERDGFTIMEGYVNRPEALKYSAEEFYEILLQEKQEQQNKMEQQMGDAEQSDQTNESDQENEQSKGESSGGDNKQGKSEGDSSDQNNEDEKSDRQAGGQSINGENQDGNEQYMGDDHSLWEEAFEKRKEGKKSDKKHGSKNKDKDLNGKPKVQDFNDYDEREEFSSNREERIAKAKENLERAKKDMLSNNSDKINLGGVGNSAEELDWRLLLRREIDKTETIWSQRKSIAENNYAYRLEEYDVEDEAETEVMIDVSGSVDLDLVRAFLRIIKPIIKHSKLKVGCFNEKFWGMVDIKKTADIDNFEIPEGSRGHSAWTEDWDLAVRCFSKKREVNKLVFTDGWPCPGTMPGPDLKNENVIWIVYGNKDFRPCCGTVIQITERQLEQLTDCRLDSGSGPKL